MKKVVVMTGGSSGIGLLTAAALRDAGYRVYEISRRPSEIPDVQHISGDVTSEESVRSAVAAVMEAEGRIDILINNAGFGISGAVEYTDMDDARRQFDVNFFGMARMCAEVLPHMRKAGQGRILNLSSVAAAIPIPFQTFYSASKAAVNAYTLALGNEVRPYGISVCAVMPGDIRTGFTAARKKANAGDAEYGGRVSRSVEKMEQDEKNGMEPASVARFLCRLAGKKSVKPLYSLRTDYRFFCASVPDSSGSASELAGLSALCPVTALPCRTKKIL